jgi:hypothetical protein
MNYLRSATANGAVLSAPRRSNAGRQMTHYLMDLVASVVVVLAVGWFIQASASKFHVRDALITQNEVYVAISRLTPRNLLASYGATVEHMAQGVAAAHDTAGNPVDVVRQGVISTAVLGLNLIVAVPLTLAEIYQETGGAAGWIVLVGFGMVATILIAALLYARTSPWRLLRAMALVPLAVSLVFMALQGFMVLMLYAFFWFTTLAPYTVACPVLCTLYWAVRPNADRGITASLAHVVLRRLEPGRA